MIQLLDRLTRKPVSVLRMLRDNILVTHYHKPEVYGSLLLSAAHSEDKSNSLWEVLMSTPAGDEAAGTPLTAGMILTTLRRWPEDSGLVTPDGRNVFVLSIAAAGVRGITNYTVEDQGA